MKTRISIPESLLALVLLIFGLAHQEVMGQVQVNGGNITLAITSGMAGSEPLAVTNTATTLRYRRENVATKLTVSTICQGQRFNLKVLATAVGAGTPAPQVSLVHGMLATDFITGIPTRPPAAFETASLQYTASATFSQGNSSELGDDVHTVTYTLVAQ